MTFKCVTNRLWWLNNVYRVKDGRWKKGGRERTETTTLISRLFARFSYHESRMMPSRLPGESRLLAQRTQQGDIFGISSSFSWGKNVFLLIIGCLKYIYLDLQTSLPRKWSQLRQHYVTRKIILRMSFWYNLKFSRCLYTKLFNNSILLLDGGESYKFCIYCLTY